MDNINALKEKAEVVIHNIREYFLRRGLLLNANKTQCMFIGTPQYISKIPEDTVIKCNNEIIRPSHHVKNLGLHMDRHLTFGPHIDELCRTVSGILMYLNRIKDYFDEETRILIVQSLVSSVINYCIKIWGTTNSLYLEKVQKIQNFAARVAVQGVRKYDHITPTLKRLKWLRIKEKYKYEVGLFTFKVLNNKFPDWLYHFPNVGNIRVTLTRQNRDLFVKHHRTDLGSRSMLIRGPSHWNNLPRNVKDCLSFSLFKEKLKDAFL